ncbi:21 kDa subunit of NADH dehydrogenase [Coprinopsis marcescibilis]|uniref:21 kDa subunit of NADH dehydrogenase n=1 Tax=Coprinopsis marcescibilis TaxID=230819 RepID=A0A5C3KZT2_COPMA|nr:21 kDa subunit of NADH dehydrogenase [Coprinopsis marcescibilis]
MATKKAADSTLYHLTSRGFWGKFREVVAVNPEISTGLPLASQHRYPPPASRPEKYSTPATKASDPAQNPYWKRDVRRAYPQLSVVTQSELSGLILEHSGAPRYVSVVAAPAESSEKAGVPATKQVDLSEAIATVTKTDKIYTESRLPPALPTPFSKWNPELSPPPPHAPHSFFPMSLYR